MIKETQDKVAQMNERHSSGWDLISVNYDEVFKIINEHRYEGAFVGERRYNLHDLDHINDKLNETD